MGCECFDPRVSAVNIQKGFEKSFVSGVKAVVRVGKDLLARGKELNGADFSQNYEIVGGRLHWEGDEHPVEYHLRRYTAWLIGRGASPDLVLQSKLDRQVFKQVQEAVLQLRDGMTINWLSFKTTNPSDGAAFHQLAMVNGKLVQRSRLLPFEDADQMSRLVTVMSQNRDDLSVATDDGLSPLLGWVTMGKAVDFDKELPVMVRESSWVNQQEVERPIHMIESMSGGTGVGVHLGSGHEEVSVSDYRIEEEITGVMEVTESTEILVQPHPRGGVELAGPPEPRATIQVGEHKERKSVKAEKVMVSQVTLPIYEGIAISDVHLGSVHEKVSVTEVPVYTLPVVVAPVASDFRIEERVTENLSAGRQGTEVTEGTEKVVMPAVTLPRYEDITISDVHLGSGHEDAAEKFVSRFARNKPAEYQECKSVKMVPSAVAPVLIANELQAWSVSDYRIEKEITDVTEITESTEILVSAASEVIVTELPEYGEIEIVEPPLVMVSESDVHLGSVHESEEEAITESTHLQAPGALATGGQAELTEGIGVAENVRVFSAVSDQVSALSVIREAFNIELVTEHKSVKSAKAKVIWLQRQIANVVADGLMGRKDKRMANYGLLVHGLAMMQFDEVKKKQKVKRFKLSPVRVWADRVIKVVKRVKSKFRQSVYGAYNHLFVTT